MEKNKAIPNGYMTVGEAAKKMNVTVRTLQYYDREGLLSPSSESEGGRRLYTDKDVIKLYQILSLKHLGFSLDTIKNQLIDLETPADVANALAQQAATIREQVAALSKSLREIETLQEEVVQMQSVDFKKYADIITNLQMQNEFYWLIKHFDDNTLANFRNRFDKESSLKIIESYTHLQAEAIRLHEEGVPPESERGQHFAKEFWDMITEFTGGDFSIVSKLMETENFNDPDEERAQKQAIAHAFMEPALEAYFTALGYHTLEEVTE